MPNEIAFLPKEFTMQRTTRSLRSFRPFRGRRTVATAVAAASAFAALTALSCASASASGSASASDSASASASAPAPARVSGQGRIFYAYSPKDDIRFAVDAQAAPFTRPLGSLPHGMPTDARGKVTFSHYVPAKKETRRSEAAVDCLVTAGDTATFTAVVTKSQDPKEIGERMGFSVREGGPGKGRFGFHWGVSNVDSDKGKAVAPRIGTCMAPAPFAPVTKGGFTVRHADLPPLPAGWLQQ
ncbi:hypothetical protein ACIHFE_22415 [Streptomyces sp. NPDC052396]|uniref:hypothetical protein n=1 Tax=Streptomyces sp. NPDC052396 TaxID=3365689 RepID=UPI0037D71630